MNVSLLLCGVKYKYQELKVKLKEIVCVKSQQLPKLKPIQIQFTNNWSIKF